jgi:hypothetical protein
MESFGFWIGTDSGYPDQSVSPAPRQVSLSECRLVISETVAHVVMYSLADSSGSVSWNGSAYWKVKERVWLRASGGGVVRPGAPDFLAVLGSISYRTR